MAYLPPAPTPGCPVWASQPWQQEPCHCPWLGILSCHSRVVAGIVLHHHVSSLCHKLPTASLKSVGGSEASRILGHHMAQLSPPTHTAALSWHSLGQACVVTGVTQFEGPCFGASGSLPVKRVGVGSQRPWEAGCHNDRGCRECCQPWVSLGPDTYYI